MSRRILVTAGLLGVALGLLLFPRRSSAQFVTQAAPLPMSASFTQVDAGLLLANSIRAGVVDAGTLVVSGGASFNAGVVTIASNTITSYSFNGASGATTQFLGNCGNSSGCDGAGQIKFTTAATLTRDGGVIAEWDNFGVRKMILDKFGLLKYIGGDSTASPGNATINAVVGRSAVAQAASSVTITNSVVDPTTIVSVTPLSSALTDCAGWYVTVAAGSFTVTCPSGVTAAAWSFSWTLAGTSNGAISF